MDGKERPLVRVIISWPVQAILGHLNEDIYPTMDALLRFDLTALRRVGLGKRSSTWNHHRRVDPSPTA
jgi:hypothetical protein